MEEFELEPLSKEEELELETTLDLEALKLKWEDLEGKTILDVGAGSARLAEVASKKGIKVVSLDYDSESVKSWQTEGREIYKESYVEGESERMPFKDEAFDIIISHGGPPLTSRTKEEVILTIKEFERVLKKGGKAVFGFAFFNPEIIGRDTLNPILQDFKEKEFKDRIKDSFEFLKSINKNIEITKTTEGRFKTLQVENYFYTFTK